MKTAYEKHPVTAERKAELVAQGFKIIDAKFKPDDVPTKVRRKRKAKIDNG